MTFVYALSHYFLPSHTNNHKAKILHSSSLLLVSLFLVIYQLLLHTFPLTGVKILGYAANIPPNEIISLTNQKRAAAGQSALVYSSVLSSAAKVKGDHMLANDYWAHVAPDGTEPWKFFADAGYKYKYAGENLARDFSNPTNAMEAWMASPSHRDNLLSAKYNEIGVAVVEGDLNGVDTTIIVQFFGTRLGDTTTQVPAVAAKPAATAIPAPTNRIVPTTAPTLVPGIEPTVVPVVAFTSPPPASPVPLMMQNAPVSPSTSKFRLLISPFQTTRGISLSITLILLIVMVADGIIVARRKIPRLGGRTIAHIAFLGMILAIVLIARAG